MAWSDKARGLTVTVTLMCAYLTIQFNTYIDTSFFVEYYKHEKNITGKMYGCINLSQGIGFSVNWLLSSVIIRPIIIQKLGYRLPSIKVVHLICLSLAASWALAMSFTPLLTNTYTVFGVATALKFLYGMLHYTFIFNMVNGLEAWFPGKFFLANSFVTGCGHALGQSLGAYVGSYIYVNWSFAAAYRITGELLLLATAVCFFLLPKSDDDAFFPLSEKKHFFPISNRRNFDNNTELLEHDVGNKKHRLSPLIVTVVITLAIIQAVPGYLFITIVPYLQTCCSLNLNEAAGFLFFFFLVTGLGFLLSGYIAQKQVFSLHVQTIIGAMLCITCLIITFPPPEFVSWYKSTKYLAYFSLLMVAIGDPLHTSNNKKHMEQVQTEVLLRSLSKDQQEFLGSIWTVTYGCGFSIGCFIGGFLQDKVSHNVSAWIMASIVSITIPMMLLLIALKNYNERRYSRKQEVAGNC